MHTSRYKHEISSTEVLSRYSYFSLQFVSNACTYVTNKPAKDLRDIFYASSVATILGNFCKVSTL